MVTCALVILAILAALLVVLSIYPGEFSWVSTRANRWLYDRGAATYEDKWQRHDYGAYAAIIADAAQSLEHEERPLQVLDLACGTGRATLFAAQYLPPTTRFTAVDYSRGMLEVFQSSVARSSRLDASDITWVECELAAWLDQCEQSFDLVLFMEAAEFVPGFSQLPAKIHSVCAPGAQLVMTRPAGLWGWMFPGRHQTRRALAACLGSAGFAQVRFVPWRSRYELLAAHR
jgi:SAM-dependent methyltransferase